ncbi:MAG TPA: hypothetical protein VGM51_12635 [Armatimonadota bacterium]
MLSSEREANPFVVLMRKDNQQRDGSFRPVASLAVTSALRTSGLWRALPPEEFKNLILLLTYLSPNGDCLAAVTHLAEAMDVSEFKARVRLSRLARFSWHDQPLVIQIPRGGSLDAFAPAPFLVRHEEAPAVASTATETAEEFPGREAVIRHSRETYARPRAEVEREIAEANGWIERKDDGEARAALVRLGFSNEGSAALVSRYGSARVLKQVEWLPYRHAKDPIRFLIAAIEHGYEAPRGLAPHVERPDTSQPKSALP